MKHILNFVVLFLLFPILAFAESFKITDIRVEGLQRVSAGSVFAALPISVGDMLTDEGVTKSIRALFETGYFENINVGRQGSVLVFTVQERPSISEIVLEGNKAIETENLLKGLKDSGLAEGQVFRRATLEGVRLELQRQYVSQGRYGATVETVVKELPRNRVALTIKISEGKVAAIKHINIIGNTVFPQQDLVDLFELKTSSTWSWLSGDDKYAREKLSGDLERLSSYYLDRGYLKFNIDSTQVSISPDKQTVFVTVSVTEGKKYIVSDSKLAGELILPEEEMKRLVLVKKGSTFSQVLMTTTSDYLTQRLGNEGYTFAKVRGIPEIDENTKTVKVTFFVEPNNRTYVRRINFRGNTKTTDEVLRREMRQMEGAVASSSQIEQSKVRLSRLGFFKDVQVETPTVPGTSDQIDVEYTVEEQSSGSIGASIGFAQGTGIILGANIQQRNFMGTGKKVGFGINTSEFQKLYSYNYEDPYYTTDGVSRGFSIYYRSYDLEEVNIASYRTDTLGSNITFGYPISEIERLGFAFGYSDTKIKSGVFAVQEIKASPRVETFSDITKYMKLDDYYSVFGDSAINAGLTAEQQNQRVRNADTIDDGIDLPDDGTQQGYYEKYNKYHSEVDKLLPENYDELEPDAAREQRAIARQAVIDKNSSDTDSTNDVLIPDEPLEPDLIGFTSWDLSNALLDVSDLSSEQLSTSPDGFLDIYGNRFKNFSITSTWSQSTLNRGQLATLGSSQSVSLEVAVPGSDLEYFKLIYSGQIFRPLTDTLTLRLKTQLGVGDGLGSTNVLPFYEHFFAGGFGSVRGFRRNTLGPRSTPSLLYSRLVDICVNGTQTTDNQVATGGRNCGAELEEFYLMNHDERLMTIVQGESEPFGGDVLIEGGVEILFPMPFVKDQRSMQSAIFLDAGNAFSRSCSASQINCFEPDLGELRYSVGVGLTWITGFGPLTFSLGKALNANSDDDTEVFQFSLGQGF